jgi:hypothetical protein
MLWVVAVGFVVAVLGFRICTPPCPGCGSERTLARRFDLGRDARVIEGEGGARRARVG